MTRSSHVVKVRWSQQGIYQAANVDDQATLADERSKVEREHSKNKSGKKQNYKGKRVEGEEKKWVFIPVGGGRITRQITKLAWLDQSESRTFSNRAAQRVGCLSIVKWLGPEPTHHGATYGTIQGWFL